MSIVYHGYVVLTHPFLFRNELERIYLEQIHFYVNVPSSMYAQYFFDLRSLAEENGLVFPNEYLPLTKDRAIKIEVSLIGWVWLEFSGIFKGS